MIKLYENKIEVQDDKVILGDKVGIYLEFPTLENFLSSIENDPELKRKILESDYEQFKIDDEKHALEFFRWWFNDDNLEQCQLCHNYTAHYISSGCLDDAIDWINYECEYCGANYYES